MPAEPPPRSLRRHGPAPPGHVGYGTSLGALRGLVAVLGLHGLPGAATHFGLAWGMEQVTLPATGASTPAWKWSRREVAIDAFHHAVYAAGTGLAYDWLDRH